MHEIITGLLSYLSLLILLTFHEFAHAWVAWKCGDDTARLQGRVSLNPVVHMDPLGTVLLPLLVIVLRASGSGLADFIIGWGKPVPVNPHNLRRPRLDDTLISMAGPAMNFVLAIGLLAVAKGFQLAHLDKMVPVMAQMTIISLLLCFFNLIPIPPLDGSHLIKNAIGMSDETYYHLSRFGFLAVILIIQVPVVQRALSTAVALSFTLMAAVFRF